MINPHNDSAFYAYYEWAEQQLQKIESEKEDSYWYWETPWFSMEDTEEEEEEEELEAPKGWTHWETSHD